MPLTVIDIERRKNSRIAVFFVVLLIVYLAVILLVSATFDGVPGGPSSQCWTATLLVALIAAGAHFWFSASRAVETMMRTLNASAPDPKDEVHRRFLHIVEEVHVATGRRREIRSAVIPSLSMNALAVADLRGNALIAITEGLLSRLTRPQTEAVVAHEAHHIISNDCLEASVAASLFGTLSSALEQISAMSRRRAFALPAMTFAWIFLQLGNLLNLFISREREYRADAASVRMTRNPLALAETLHLLSRSWRGAGFIGSGLEMLCIANPRATVLEEREGPVADLLSTHPPVRKRIGLLLAMARVAAAELDRRADAVAPDQDADRGARYRAMSPRQQWQGPFTLQELAALPWLTPLTWVASGAEAAPARAWRDPLLTGIFAARLTEERNVATDRFCPACRQPLHRRSYAGTQVAQCCFCAGTLVETEKIPRIIARTVQERPCSERINALARTVLQENQARRAYRAAGRAGIPAGALIPCPQCANPMHRGLYSMSYLIDIDRCSYCGLTWFDQDELAMLQCMIENRLAPEPADISAADG